MSKEKPRFREEPGIVRNLSGRIIETGWPKIDPSRWPEAFAELDGNVQAQIRDENFMVEHGDVDVVTGAIRIGSGVFNLAGKGLLFDLQSTLAERMKEIGEGEVLEICDLGGGNGFLLERGTMEWTNRYARGFKRRSQIATTLTTLVNHDPEILAGRLAVIDSLLVGTAAELPGDDLFERFDVITAQNSVFFWSSYPELALLNMFKMLKPGGVILVTVPVGLQPVTGDEEFEMINLIWECELFDCEQIGKSEKDVRFKLEKRK